MTTTLYLDMDGVLADFNGWAQTVLCASDGAVQTAVEQGRWSQEEWAQLKSHPDLYRQLNKTSLADPLVALARQFKQQLGWNLAILTAIPRGNDVPRAFQDKIEWVQQHYPDLPVYFGPYSADKHLHCQPGDLLVDDRTDNCQSWRSAGGCAIQVYPNSPQAALEELNRLLEQYLSDRDS